MRRPRLRYTYVDVDRTTPPASCDSQFRVAVLDARPRNRSLQAYSKICEKVLPNVSANRLITTGGTCNVVITKSGECIGGLTFRLIDVETMPCIGAPRPRLHRKLACDILLTAVRGDHQGQGLGRWLVDFTKRIAMAHAVARGIDVIHMVVQADLDAVSFWKKLGFGNLRAARRLVAGLSRWRPAENLIYIGATPLSVLIDVSVDAPLTPHVDVSVDAPEAVVTPASTRSRRGARRWPPLAPLPLHSTENVAVVVVDGLGMPPTRCASGTDVSQDDESDALGALESSAAGSCSPDSIEGDRASASAASSCGESGGLEWCCAHCTLLNEGWRLKCRLCLRRTKRPGGGDDGCSIRWPRAIFQLCDTPGNGPNFASSLVAAMHQLPPLYIPVVGDSYLYSVGKRREAPSSA